MVVYTYKTYARAHIHSANMHACTHAHTDLGRGAFFCPKTFFRGVVGNSIKNSLPSDVLIQGQFYSPLTEVLPRERERVGCVRPHRNLSLPCVRACVCICACMYAHKYIDGLDS